jgi:hypothetical protein
MIIPNSQLLFLRSFHLANLEFQECCLYCGLNFTYSHKTGLFFFGDGMGISEEIKQNPAV